MMRIRDFQDGECIELSGVHALAFLATFVGAGVAMVTLLFMPRDAAAGIWAVCVSQVLLGPGVVCVGEGLKRLHRVTGRTLLDLPMAVALPWGRTGRAR